MASRRRMVWVPVTEVDSVATGASGNVDLLQNLTLDLESVGGLTVTRIIGLAAVHPPLVGDLARYAMGIRVANDNLGSANPDIATDPTGIFLWTWIGRTSGWGAESAAGVFSTFDDYIYFDVKAQRKMKPDDQLLFVLQNGADEIINAQISARSLLKLP